MILATVKHFYISFDKIKSDLTLLGSQDQLLLQVATVAVPATKQRQAVMMGK